MEAATREMFSDFCSVVSGSDAEQEQFVDVL